MSPYKTQNVNNNVIICLNLLVSHTSTQIDNNTQNVVILRKLILPV